MDMARVDLGSEKIENAQQVCFSPPPCWLAPCHSTGRLNRIIYTKGIHSRVSIDTLYWYPQLILSIDTRDQFPQSIPLIDTSDQFPQSIPLFDVPVINSLNRYPWSTPSIDTLIDTLDPYPHLISLIDTPSTPWFTLSQQSLYPHLCHYMYVSQASTNFWLINMSWLKLSWLSANCW